MSVKQHYTQLYQKFGPSPQAVQWSSKQTQKKRFEVLCNILKKTDSVIDIGCGLGDMLEFLRNEKNFTGRYLGLDFVPDFINYANAKFQNDTKAEFSIFDINNDTLPNNFDTIMMSGVFNNLMDDNWKFITNTLQKIFQATNRVVSINALSTYVDYQDSGLYYTNPIELFDFCKTEISPKLTLHHDYLVKENSIPFEFTMHLYK
tara:strand:+ start:67 stop:678 length:612 start_codon:yes stop_codon:yes gene_type:complete